KLRPPAAAPPQVGPAISEGSDGPAREPPALPARPRFRDLREVLRQDTPPDPPAHPPLPVVPAPLQPEAPPQRVDPPLDPRTELVSVLESVPPLLGPSFRRRLAHVRQRH